MKKTVKSACAHTVSIPGRVWIDGQTLWYQKNQQAANQRKKRVVRDGRERSFGCLLHFRGDDVAGCDSEIIH